MSGKTVPGQSHQKNFSLDWTKCFSQGQAGFHMQFQQIGVALACSHLLFNVYAPPNPTAPLLKSEFSHSFLLYLMHFTKAVQQSPQWISVIFMILFLSAHVVLSYRPGCKLCHHHQPFATNEKQPAFHLQKIASLGSYHGKLFNGSPSQKVLPCL